MKSMSLQAVHDHLLTVRPEGATCPEDCPFCSGEYAAAEESPLGGTNVSDDKTYTQEDVDALVTAAVAKATAPLQAELNEFKSGQESAEVEAQIAAVRSEMEVHIAELTKKLDEAVIEASQAKQERDEITAFLAAESERVQEESARATRKDMRMKCVAEVIAFPEEYVAERADKWADLSDEDFETLLADYKLLAHKDNGQGSPLPKQTAMVATREPTSGPSTVGSAVKDLIRGRNVGLDPRAIRR